MDRASRPEGTISDIQHGWDVYGSDEQKIGNVTETRGRYVIAHKGIFFPKDLYIPMAAIERIEHDRVYVMATKDEVDSQGWDVEPVDYNTGTTMTGAAVARERIPDQVGTPVGTTEVVEEQPVMTGRPMDRTDTGETMHLHEEELRANKERVEAGEVRLGKEVVEEQRTVNVPTTREEVFIERTPGDRQPDDHAFEDSAEKTISVPVTEERVNVEKVPVETEEIRVGKRQVQENQQVSGTVRREEARIENEGDVRAADRSAVNTPTTARTEPYEKDSPDITTEKR